MNEPPIINVGEPPVVDVDDGDDDEVVDNKGGGHKVSWVWRHFDQEVVKKGAKKSEMPILWYHDVCKHEKEWYKCYGNSLKKLARTRAASSSTPAAGYFDIGNGVDMEIDFEKFMEQRGQGVNKTELRGIYRMGWKRGWMISRF